MDQGKILPKELVFDFLEQEFKKDMYKQHGLILDGYPKDHESLDFLDRMLKQVGLSIHVVVYFELPRSEVERRLTSRLHCASCELQPGFIKKEDMDKHYSKLRDVGERCDACGSILMPRHDDEPEIIANRLNVFEKNTLSVIETFRKRNILRTIDARKNIEEVYQSILNAL